MDEPTAPGAVLRPTARVLLIDADERVLLFRMETLDGRVFWCPPGGGLDAGETFEQAAVRELREETGWREPALGAFLGTRRHVVTWHDGITYDCRERWFHARVDQLEVDDADWTDDERLDMGEHRWWTLADLGATREELVPRDLAGLVATVLRVGPPDAPLDLD